MLKLKLSEDKADSKERVLKGRKGAPWIQLVIFPGDISKDNSKLNPLKFLSELGTQSVCVNTLGHAGLTH